MAGWVGTITAPPRSARGPSHSAPPSPTWKARATLFNECSQASGGSRRRPAASGGPRRPPATPGDSLGPRAALARLPGGSRKAPGRLTDGGPGASPRDGGTGPYPRDRIQRYFAVVGLRLEIVLPAPEIRTGPPHFLTRVRNAPWPQGGIGGCRKAAGRLPEGCRKAPGRLPEGSRGGSPMLPRSPRKAHRGPGRLP